MPADFSEHNRSVGNSFLISAGIVYEIIAAACSSPQTTEINASARADTLMKWVNIGVAQSAVLILIGATIDPEHRAAILAGGTIAGIMMYGSYYHAKRSGLKNGGPTTESY